VVWVIAHLVWYDVLLKIFWKILIRVFQNKFYAPACSKRL
jgi:hypothetical protein